MSDFEQWIQFNPAFDCVDKRPCHFGKDSCQPGTGGSHGRGTVCMTWLLRGPLGVVQFMVYTGWGIDETRERYRWSPPLAADLGYHAPQPMYEGHEDWGGRQDCDLLPGGVCYYDGSGLAADVPWRLLREQGHGAVWQHLREYYADVFESPREDEAHGATVDELLP